MRFLTTSLFALGLWAALIAPAFAGWDNVFQPTLFFKKQQPTASNYCCPQPVVAYSAPCDPCQQQKCTTNYVQRSYYQPVTTYENRTEMVPVTSYRTSYYYEPVTTVRYSAYYDPCSCSYKQVAQQSTSYQLREQKCPVQSWVSRCVQVPVQGYQKVDYWQPQTTCCTTTAGAPIIGSAPPTMAPAAPSITPTEGGPPKLSGETTKPMMFNQYYPPMEKPQPPEIRTNSTTSWTPKLEAPIPEPTQALPPPPPAPVKMDRIAVGNSTVEGTVVRSDNSPSANAKVLLIHATTGTKQTLTANEAGRFQAELATGSWHIYLHGTNDAPVYHSRIDVAGAQFRQVNLVSRSN